MKDGKIELESGKNSSTKSRVLNKDASAEREHTGKKESSSNSCFEAEENFCKKIAQMHCNSLLLNCKTEKAKKIIEKFKIEAKKLQKIAIEREEEHAEKF